ncbi:EexN family lipoprotein [Salmonella enterica subsp. enterica serovar Pomona]|nr:EexN family lipoprotein [Salmonella enterica subsp. enterica serovar Pomona]
MRNSKIVFLFSMVFLVAGCKEKTKSVDWWTNHPKEAVDKYKECKKSGSDSENCKNVKRAGLIISDTYPPMNEIYKQEAKELDKKLGTIK